MQHKKFIPRSHHLRKGSFLKTVTFQESSLSGGGFVQNKDTYTRATFLKQVLLYRINFFRKVHFGKKLNFQKSNIPYYLLFLESCFIEWLLFRKGFAFYSSCFSKELLFHNIVFQRSF